MPHQSLCVAALGLCLLLPAMAQLPATATPPLHGIAHVAIRVSDLAASRSFYQKLGFEEAFALSKDSVVYESFIKINDRQFIELYPVRGQDTTIGFLHLCFEGEDLNAIHRDYTDRGLTPKMEVRKAGAGNLLFTMDGPAQPMGPQNIEYTQFLPGSLHSNDLGKHLGTDRIADRLLTVSLAMQDQAVAREFYVKQLRFLPSGTDAMVLDLPGGSGQRVEILGPALGLKARVALEAGNRQAAEKWLVEQKVGFTKAKGVLTVIDPDGNLILIQSRQP